MTDLGNTQAGKSTCVYELTNIRQLPTMIITTFVFTGESIRPFQRHNTHTSEYKKQGP